MRNPLKKIKKKINMRLANNAAQHSQTAKPSSPNGKNGQDNTSTSLTSRGPDHEDPLFNNRSSKLRLALAESKKNNSHSDDPFASSSNNNTPNTTPKKKKTKGKGRFSFGGSRKTQAIGSVNPQADTNEEVTTTGSKSASPKKSPRTPSRTAANGSPVKSPRAATRSSFDSPTMASQQRCRDKAEVTPSVRPTNEAAITSKIPPPSVYASPNQKAKIPPPSVYAPTNQKAPPRRPTAKPAMQDPNLERIAKAAAALDNTGNALFERGEYDKAMASYVKALKLKNRTLAGAPIDETNPTAVVPQLPLETKPAEKATTEPSSDQTTPPPDAKEGADDLWISVATSINNIGYLRQQSGQASADETMQAYQNSLQIKRRVLGKDNLSVGKTLNNLGTVHYLKREYEQALNAYREALQIMMATLGPHHLDVGTVHSNIGDVYWAQSGEVNMADTNGCPQQNYQASRNAALQHYRQSLEIRWEELRDHHDPKVIRLLEKIAALEMGESFLQLVQNNHKHRLSPKGAGSPGQPQAGLVDPDEALEAEGSKAVVEELQTLQEELRSDVKEMDMMERKMAIDMVKDKLRLIREMKKLSSLNIYNSDDEDDGDDLGILSGALTPKAPPLSPVQRTEALCAVKERLRQLRDSRTKDSAPLRRFPVEASDLKEADRSPSNYFLSHRAEQLLNRTLQPPPSIKGLDELRNFSFNETENDPEAGDPMDLSGRGFDVSRKAVHTLEEGIDALRSISINQDNVPKDGNPWVIASAMETNATSSPEKPVCSPKTPLPAASMAGF